MIYDWKAKLVRVIDGDTISIDLDQGFGDWKHDFPVRLAHINAPELNAPGGKEAKAHLQELLGNAQLYLVTFKPKDKYGRYLADIHTDAGLSIKSINQQMIDNGHAIAYEGGAR